MWQSGCLVVDNPVVMSCISCQRIIGFCLFLHPASCRLAWKLPDRQSHQSPGFSHWSGIKKNRGQAIVFSHKNKRGFSQIKGLMAKSKPYWSINGSVHGDSSFICSVSRKRGVLPHSHVCVFLLAVCFALAQSGHHDSDPWSVSDLCCLFVCQLVCLLCWGTYEYSLYP